MSVLSRQILKKSRHEDRLAEQMKLWRENFNESASIKARIRIWRRLRRELLDVRPDLSNFDAALRRWKKRIKMRRTESEEQIEDWFRKPAEGVTASHLIKQAVVDLMTHGRASAETCSIDGRKSLFTHPGGTVVPVRGTRVGPVAGYIQLWNEQLRPVSLTGEMPTFFLPNELVYSYYMP